MSRDVTAGPGTAADKADKGGVIARLGALLERVRLRAAEPRHASAMAPAPEPVAADGASAAPPGVAPLDARADGRGAGAEIDVEVDVAGLGETEGPLGVAEEGPVSDPLDSRERLVAAQPLAPEPAPPEMHADLAEAARQADEADEAETPQPADSGPPIDVAEIEVVVEEPEEDEPPVSSRRPVVAEAEERLAQLAFGAEEPAPLHPPPPESGRLPSAPALFDRDVTGVRNAGPNAPRRPNDSPPPPAPELVAEPTRPELAASTAVADIVAEAQSFAPATFVALLDASLAL